MKRKLCLALVTLLGLGFASLLHLALKSSTVQAASTTRYVAEHAACGVKSPCYADIQAAIEDSSTGDEILVAGGVYSGVQTQIYNGEVISQVVFINKDLSIQGGYLTTTWSIPEPLANPTIIDAQEMGRGLFITGGISVTLEGLRLVHGRAFQQSWHYTIAGGGIYVASAIVTINNCQLTSNTGSSGAGIYNAGVLTLNNCEISGNTASASAPWTWGGGIANSDILNIYASAIMSNSADIAGGIGNFGKLKVISSTISYNQAPNIGRGNGGGIQNLGAAELINSAVLNNTSLLGGGISNSDQMTITNTTISQNWSSSASVAGVVNRSGALTITFATIVSNTGTITGLDIGSGIHNEDIDGTIVVANSIIAYNSAENCGGVITSSGHNLEDSNWCGLSATGDLTNTYPMLDNLAYYGGPTLVYGLLMGSPALDKGDSNACPATDQRGVTRPQGPGCDIGAFELQTFSQYLPYLLNQNQ